MSAYVVNRETIGNIIAGALIRGVTYQHNGQTMRLEINDTAAGVRVGQMLWDANISSVLHLYPNDTIATMPGPRDQDYTFRAEDIREDNTPRGTSWSAKSDEHPLAVAIRCLNYQACERDDWPTSESKAFLDALAAQLPDELRALQAKARVEAIRLHEQQQADRAAAIARGRAWLATHQPAGAVAVIVAEQHEDDSDSQSDYFNHTTARRIVLAWSTHQRTMFSEMRKAAARCGLPELAHLGPGRDVWTPRVVFSNTIRGNGCYHSTGDGSPWHTDFTHDEHGSAISFETEAEARAYIASKGAPYPVRCGDEVASFVWDLSRESIEHRENYSMGGGYYLKAGWRHSSGWCIRKRSIDDTTAEAIGRGNHTLCT